MSEICITSSKAATRGIRFLPAVVAGAIKWLWLLGQLYKQWRHIFREAMLVSRILGEQDALDTGDLRGGLGDTVAILAGDDHLDVITGDFFGGGQRVQSRGFERPVIVFGDDESSHQITRASVLSLSTSSATEPTFRPPCRFGGSSTLRTVRRGVTSTPSVSGVVVTIGFFFALMMFGSDA